MISIAQFRGDDNPDQRLWRMVILQALIDARYDESALEKVRTHYTEKNRLARRIERIRAVAWLRSNSRSFHDVCHLAGYDPQWLRDVASRILAGQGNDKTLRDLARSPSSIDTDSLSAIAENRRPTASATSTSALATTTCDPTPSTT